MTLWICLDISKKWQDIQRYRKIFGIGTVNLDRHGACHAGGNRGSATVGPGPAGLAGQSCHQLEVTGMAAATVTFKLSSWHGVTPAGQ